MSTKASGVLSTRPQLRQLHGRGRTKLLRGTHSHTGRRTMATSHEIRNGLDSLESDMGVGRTTIREKTATLQMGFSVQICIRLGKTQIQSSACREGLQTRERGVDYDEIFSPVVKMNTLRLLLGVVATEDLELEQLNVKKTFLHGDLDEDLYMSQPEGFSATGEESHLVC